MGTREGGGFDSMLLTSAVTIRLIRDRAGGREVREYLKACPRFSSETFVKN